MKEQMSTMFSLVVFMALVLAVLPSGTVPAVAQGPESPYSTRSLPGSPPLLDHGLSQPSDGLWVMPAGARPSLETAGVSPQATGGPDDFGYTWDDSLAMNWVDATSGTNTGLSQGSWGASVTGGIPLGFDFEFYENSYTAVYISSAGAVGFDRESLEGEPGTDYVPSPDYPNNFIAPYLAPLRLNASGYDGQVHYLQGGTEPNRYFVVEWHQVNDGAGGSFTFQVVLQEDGDILFQYLNMEHEGGYYCSTFAGIEDETGWAGLAYLQAGCNYMEHVSGKAVLFDRPAPSARVSIKPAHQGRFVSADETATFEIPVRNTGQLGADTYDVTVSSTWPVALYQADGATPLTDTDGDTVVDIGSVAQCATATVVAKVTAPTVVSAGDTNEARITVQSSVDTDKHETASLRTGVPAPFAQVYRDDADGAMSLYLAQPGGQKLKKATDDYHYGNDMAVAEMPDGFTYLWTRSHRPDSVRVCEIQYTLLDHYGESTRSISKLTDHSGAAVNTYDYAPAVAVAPNGRIGVLWYRYLYNSDNDSRNHNIFFAILDSSGDRVYGPVNLTNNDAWGTWSDYGLPMFREPHITATDDNRFVLAWERTERQNSGWSYDICYTVRDTSGNPVKGVTNFTNGVAGKDYYSGPSLASLSSSRALLAYQADGGISYAVLDSTGATVKEQTGIGDPGYLPDAMQLSDRSVLLAWTHWGSNAEINFAVLNGDTYDVVAGPTALSNPAAATGNDFVSVAADGAGRGILTWMDANYGYRRNLYYALVDGNGSVLADPMIFRTGQGTLPHIQTSFQGYGNTSYSWTPPADVDGVATFSASLFGAPAGDNAAVDVHYANHGLATASHVVLTATLDSNLSYMSDTSGITPTMSGNDMVWSLPDLDFLDSEDFTLYAQVPSGAALGTRYPVTLTLTSDGPEANTADNTTGADVVVARQVFLPLILRGY